MSTATVQPGRSAAVRRSAVRVGTRTHVGYLSCDTTPDGGPLYVAACNAGQRDGVASPRAGCAGRVDCGNCGRRYADVVAEMNAAHDAATGRADIRSADDTPARPLTAPTPATLATARECGPFMVWGAIRICANANSSDPTRRLRAAWVREALREVYGLSMAAAGAEILDAASADTRDGDTCTRDYLTAYAGQIDDRAEAVDLHAAAFQTHDVDQAHAGIRPHVGEFVLVDGHAGRWEVMRRSPVEARRFPFRIRVRQEGHTFNGSVHLTAITRIPAAPAVTNTNGWVPAVTADVQDADGVREESMRDATDGGRAAEVWSTERSGLTNVWRTSTLTLAEARATRAEALAAARILDTVTAGELAAMPGAKYPEGADGVVLVLADGTRVRVLAAHRADAGAVTYATPGGWGYEPGAALAGRVVILAVRVEGKPLTLRAPLSLNLPRLVDAPTWRLTLPLSGRVALAPASV